MKIIEAEHDELGVGPGGSGIRLTWRDVLPGDECRWASYPHLRHKTLTVTGALAGDAAVHIEGTNVVVDRIDAVAAGLSFPLHDDISGALIEAPGLYVLAENPLAIRPVAVSGGPYTVRIVAVH